MNGFTLLEMLIGLALGTAVLGSAAFFDLDSYTHMLGQSDADMVLTALLHARAESLNGICNANCTSNKSHGVYLTDSRVAIFEGSSYANPDTTANEYFALSGSSIIQGASEIVFYPFTARTLGTTTLSISRQGFNTKTIVVYPDGEISSNI